jgi:hypothetical protein
MMASIPGTPSKAALKSISPTGMLWSKAGVETSDGMFVEAGGIEQGSRLGVLGELTG